MTTNRKYGLGFLTAGFLFSIFYLFDISQAFIARSWPTVQGEILSSSVGESMEMSSKGRGRPRYDGNVTYSYSVNDQSFQNDRVCFGYQKDLASYENANQIRSKYPKGKKVKIYYDPNNPEESVLQTNIPGRMIAMTVTGLVFILTGFYYYFLKRAS